eukprot:scaffold2.g7197.t1
MASEEAALQPLLSHAISIGRDDSLSSPQQPPPAAEPGAVPFHATEDVEEPPGPSQSSVATAAANATNGLVGAGLLALPRVFAGLGLALGSALTLAVAALTLASIDIMLRAARRGGKRNWSYASLMEAAGIGFLILYLVICVDMLLGTTSISGLLPDLLPRLPSPPPWWLGRSALLAWTTLAAAPLLLSTSLRGVLLVSIVSITCSISTCLTLMALCVAAGVQGKLGGATWLPDPSVFGEGGLATALGSLGTVGVVMTAFVIQHQVPPLVLDLQDPTPSRQLSVFKSALTTGAVIYVAVGVSGAVTFGSGVAGDVLASMNVGNLASLLWGSRAAAVAAVISTKGLVVLSLLTSFPITLWPLRGEVIALLLRGLGGSQVSVRTFRLLTFAIMAAILGLAIASQSMYQLDALIGSVSGVLLAFVFPGLLALHEPSAWRRALGRVLLPLGAACMVTGVGSTLWGAPV